MMRRPENTEFPPFFARYVSLVAEHEVIPALEAQTLSLRSMISSIPAERELFRYAEEKWSIRKVFGHLHDVERVLGYRAFCISRGDKSNFPSFDENAYVEQGDSDTLRLINLAAEFEAERNANVIFLRRLDEKGMAKIGIVNAHPITVRALMFIMVGHFRHHCIVLRDRYGVTGDFL